jgi:hypothetical protein
MGNKKQATRGNLSDIRGPQPARRLAPAATEPAADPSPIPPIDLPAIDEPELVAPLVLAIAEELTDDSPSKKPKKAKLHPLTKVTTHTVEIKIALPSMPDLTPITTHPIYATARSTAAKVPRKKLALSGIVIAVILFIIGSNLLADHNARVAADKRSGLQSLAKATPDYPTVLPAGKNIKDLGGWTLVSPPNRDPAFAYIDKIGNMQINVSQQQLPAEFKQKTAEKIEKLAKEYGASEKVSAGNTPVYIGTSEKGPQSVIFTKNDLLILIKSAVKIDNAVWADYVESLH